MKRPIFIISGVPGAGKTSVASLLMQRFPLGLHIPVDDLREWVVSGIAQPVPTWTDETSRQFRFARQAAAEIARIYAGGGFSVAIDDVILPYEAMAIYGVPLSDYTVHKVLLRPDLDVALARNAERTNKTFDTSVLADAIRRIHESTSTQVFSRAGWIIIDSSPLSLDETVEEILTHI